jgi:hypothetical protein
MHITVRDDCSYSQEVCGQDARPQIVVCRSYTVILFVLHEHQFSYALLASCFLVVIK